MCAPFVGKVLIDDVWSGGRPDGKHMLMSTAIAKGLYHPRCKDVIRRILRVFLTRVNLIQNQNGGSL